MPIAPVSWTTGSFGDDLIFNCNMMDHAGSNPQISGKFALPADKALNGGWIWRNGKLLLITRARKTITRDPDSFVPQSITLHLTTEDGRETVATGTLVASCPWATWPNIMANISLIRWEMEGRVGYGDAQDVLWNDFVNAAAEARVRT
jgi:hypothetical protein